MAGIDAILNAHRGLTDATSGLSNALENRNTRIDRDEEQRKKEEAEEIRKARLQEVTSRIPDLTEAAQDPAFSYDDFANHETTQEAINAAIETGDPNVLRSLGPIQDILNARQQEDLENVKLGKQAEIDKKREERENKKLQVDLRKEKRAARQDYEGNAVTKRTDVIREAFGKIKSAAKSQTAAGDLSLVFGYMRMLDPNSTVRESEFQNAEKARSYFSSLPTDEDGNKVTENGIVVPSFVASMFQKMDPEKGGAFLLPEQRKQFMNEAGGLYETQLNMQLSKDEMWMKDAEDMGVDPSEIVGRPAKKDLEELAKWREEAAKAEAEEKEKNKQPEGKVISEEQYNVLVSNPKNQAAFAAAVNAENAKRAAAGQPPMSEEEKEDAIQKVLEKKGFILDLSGSAPAPQGQPSMAVQAGGPL